MQQLSASQATPEATVNENFETLEQAAVYGKRHPVTTALTWGYYGGRWGGFAVADGTVTLTNNATNYLVVERATGTLSVATSNTNWNNGTAYARVYKLTTSGGVVTATEDHRAGPGGVHGSAAVSIVDMIGGVFLTPSNRTYLLVVNSAYAGTINSVTTKCTSGTCTLTAKINGTALGGTANSVSSTEETQTHSSGNAFVAGDDIQITVSSNSSCADLTFNIKVTR